MLALFDGLPRFCPQCGAHLNKHDWRPTESDRQYGIDPKRDYYARCSHNCTCGLSYQYVEREHLLAAADASGGDMRQYV